MDYINDLYNKLASLNTSYIDFKSYADPLLNWVETVNTTETASYIVFTDGSKYYAKNGLTGMIEYSDVDATKVIQYAIDKIVEKDYWGTVFLKAGVYYLTDTIYLWCGVGLVGEKHGWSDLPLGQNVYSGTILYGNFNKPIIKIAVHPNWVGANPTAYNSRKNFAFIKDIALFGSGKSTYTSQNNIEITNETYIYDLLIERVFSAYAGNNGLYVNNPPIKIYISQSFFEANSGSGIRVDKAARLFIVDTLIGANKGHGIHFAGWVSAGLAGVDISSNAWSGVRIDNAEVAISASQILNNGYHGVHFILGYLSLAGNVIESNGGTTDYSNVRVDGGRAVITGNIIADFRSPPKAGYNIDIRGGEVVIVGNHFPPAFAPALGMINEAGGTRLIRNNYGYTNVNSGVATIPAGSTRVTVSHGLVKAPPKVLITPLAQPPGKLWVENITSTSFDIVTDTAPSADLKVAWYAEV